MSVGELLRRVRASEVPDADLSAFVAGVVEGSISRPQAAAWLAWAWARTLSDRETVALTRAMTSSGEVLAWEPGPDLIDKHSTGGVGDKVSLVLAPLWAELGLRVPMISGRGLGHTGGTLDKLEAIPGFRTDAPVVRLREILGSVGCFITGQTTTLAPADRILYALRNETQTIDSIPLIVASILSKKLAAGVQHLLLDVKTGSGAFMARLDDARALAASLVRVARGAGMRCEAVLTEMGRPLGLSAGNGLEVSEAVACLQGGGPPDLRALVLTLAEHPEAKAVLDSGAAFERFARMVHAQGGDPSALEDPARLGRAGTEEVVVRSSHGGFVNALDARAIGEAAFALGAGRVRAEDPVDPGVGVIWHATVGARVYPGQELATVVHRGKEVESAIARVASAFSIGEDPQPHPPLLHGRI